METQILFLFWWLFLFDVLMKASAMPCNKLLQSSHKFLIYLEVEVGVVFV